MSLDPDQAGMIDRVLETYEQPLLRYTTNLLGSLDLARDTVQDAFLQLLRGKRVNGDEKGLRGWLYKVCRNRALDYLRKESRMVPLPTEESTTPPDPAANPHDTMVRRQESAALMERVRHLPINQREVVQLKFGENRSYKEISEITGHSVSNVGFLLHTAIKALRSDMQKEARHG